MTYSFSGPNAFSSPQRRPPRAVLGILCLAATSLGPATYATILFTGDATVSDIQITTPGGAILPSPHAASLYVRRNTDTLGPVPATASRILGLGEPGDSSRVQASILMGSGPNSALSVAFESRIDQDVEQRELTGAYVVYSFWMRWPDAPEGTSPGDAVALTFQARFRAAFTLEYEGFLPDAAEGEMLIHWYVDNQDALPPDAPNSLLFTFPAKDPVSMDSIVTGSFIGTYGAVKRADVYLYGDPDLMNRITIPEPSPLCAVTLILGPWLVFLYGKARRS